MNIIELFQYGFIVRGLEAGIVVALIAPLIGIFLVLRRYSLIADTLAHVSLAGIGFGLLLKVNPFLSAIAATTLSSLAIEKLRISKKVYGESALAIFLSGSVALAVVLIGAARGMNMNLFAYLFGSILTVKQSDVVIIALLGLGVLASIVAFYKELIYVTFDEESAQVSGIPTKRLNMLLILLSAFTIALAIPIVGVLLISALLVLPVVTALQFGKSFKYTLLIAETISLFSVISGIFASFYFNIAPGGAIVLVALAMFIVSLFLKKE